MISIWKYEVPIDDRVIVEMPQGSKILSLQMQSHVTDILGKINDIPCMWALVNTESPRIDREFRWFGTGHNCNDAKSMTYVGTVQTGPYVFHLFVD